MNLSNEWGSWWHAGAEQVPMNLTLSRGSGSAFVYFEASSYKCIKNHEYNCLGMMDSLSCCASPKYSFNVTLLTREFGEKVWPTHFTYIYARLATSVLFSQKTLLQAKFCKTSILLQLSIYLRDFWGQHQQTLPCSTNKCIHLNTFVLFDEIPA